MRTIVCGRGLGLKAQTTDQTLRMRERDFEFAADFRGLKIQLQTKLELSRVKRGGGTAEVAAIAGALIE